MSELSDTGVFSALPLVRPASRVRAGTRLFLAARSSEPCGVETFTRTLVDALSASDRDGRYVLEDVSGRWRDVPGLLRQIMRADCIVFGFPLVAWKRKLAIPLLLLLFARVLRRRVTTFAHEWSGMNLLRRAVLAPYLLLSRDIVVLSPLIARQIVGDPLFGRAARKCRLVPHPPTVRAPTTRAPERMASKAVSAVERAAQNADLVIGHFGALYQGKASMALLEVCAHLRGRGIRPLMVFVGSFTPSLDGFEGKFRARVRELGLESQVIVTGYIETPEEVFALFERISAFLFLFPEGLTARRSSVITCLQSNRPVVVSEPQSRDEFVHHSGLTALIDAGALSFVPRTAGVGEIANCLLAAAERKRGDISPIDGETWWAATTQATRTAL
jgi:glycosyltransferase involved in cell wall biosynthesis